MNFTYCFGKIDYNRTGEQTHPLEINVKMETDNRGVDLLIVDGRVWNPEHDTTVLKGNILNELLKMCPDKFQDSRMSLINFLWQNFQACDFEPKPIPEPHLSKAKLVAEGKIYKALSYAI